MKFLVGLVVALGVAALIVIFALLGTLFGAFGGWVVGWFFSDTILGVLAAFGLTGFKMWQIGAFLGFFGSFFKSHAISTS